MDTYIHRYSDYLVDMIVVGLALARSNKGARQYVLISNSLWQNTSEKGTLSSCIRPPPPQTCHHVQIVVLAVKSLF